LYRRSFKQTKTEIISPIYLAQTVIISLLAGLVWFQLERSDRQARDRLGLLLFVPLAFILPSHQLIVSL
jgi:hypothetical protein